MANNHQNLWLSAWQLTVLYTKKNLTSCSSLPTSRQQVMFALLVPSCNKLVDSIRVVARLIQQVRYSHYITILLQPCDILVISWLLSDLLEQPCNKSDNVIKLVTSCWQPVTNLFQQLGTSNANTTCEQICNNLFADL